MSANIGPVTLGKGWYTGKYKNSEPHSYYIGKGQTLIGKVSVKICEEVDNVITTILESIIIENRIQDYLHISQ